MKTMNLKRMLKIELPLVMFAVLFGVLAIAETTDSFSVVAFNTWGVPFVVSDKWRYRTAMQQLATIHPDVIVLTEVFGWKGKSRFHHPEYPYFADGPRMSFPRIVGSGLRILSRYPIVRTARTVFRGCTLGELFRDRQDDCLARKGVLLVLLQLPDGRKINVVATHLDARGGDDLRAEQVARLTDFVNREMDPEWPLVVAGDFNSNPESALYPEVLESLGLSDPWTELNGSDPGYTNDCERNTYVKQYSQKHHFPCVRERIDYVLSRGLRPESSRLIFKEGKALSDHFGLWTAFSLPTPGGRISSMEDNEALSSSSESSN